MPDTPKEAALKVLRGEKADHVPNFSGMGSITLQGIQSLGYRFNEIHVDGQKMAASAATTYRLYGVESAVVPFDMGVVAESLGATVKYYDKADLGQIIYPTMTRKIIDRAAIHAPEGMSEADAKTFIMKETERQLREYRPENPASMSKTARSPIWPQALRIPRR